MTYDLVKRLRDLADCAVDVAPYETMLQAADRIEELERQLRQRDSYLVSKNLWCDFVWSVTND